MTPHSTFKHRGLQVTVQGRTWGGFNSEYVYPISERVAEGIETLKDVEPLCGDFEYLTYAEIVEVTIETTWRPIKELGDQK